MNKIKLVSTILLCVVVMCLSGSVNLLAEEKPETPSEPVAEVMYGSDSLTFMPRLSFKNIAVSVAGPRGAVATRNFDSGTPFFKLSDLGNDNFPDGVYTYEVKLIPSYVESRLRTEREIGGSIETRHSMVQTGYFSVVNGSIAAPSGGEGLATAQDVLHYDDVIITGSLCVGFDCANGESFGYCTVKLKENNLQMCFEDTSVGSFPTNDWKFQINDTTSGGASYFTLWDTDGGRRPFTVEAGAPAHSLYVEDYGRVGLGTSIPYVELHIVDGDSPTVRLDQDGSSGWTAQRWDLCGNETNFFIRDVTNGSKLCFRIQPNTPSNTLCMRSTGNVGIGTWSPEYKLEVETTGTGAQMVADRTDGATMEFSASGSYGIAGTKTNHPVRMRVNDVMIMQLNGSGDYIEMIGGGTYDGTWNPSSSRELKENIKNLSLGDAYEAFQKLSPVTYNYKANKKQDRVGFIAEDVPELVALNGRKNLGTVDIIAVLTKVVQEQQKTIDELKKEVEEMKKAK